MKLLDHWLPPDGAGDPVGCLATTFTFDADFFSSDCLARFLRLSGAHGEGDRSSDVALMLEEEERLSEARVVVLADRSDRPQARNLRWDLLPATVPGGLLHAKVALLLWQRAMRIVIGSANLTAAGYRRQIEAAAAFDVSQGEGVPRPFLDALVDELRDIVDRHTHGDVSQAGPKRRAHDVLDMAAERAASLPTSSGRGIRIAFAPSRTGLSPLGARAQVWRGGPPRRVVALAPFWDEQSPPFGAQAVLGELAKRSPADNRPTATFVVAIETLPAGAVVRAPRMLAGLGSRRVVANVHGVDRAAGDERRLHAKGLFYEGDSCVALMIGSSNPTAKGLGLDPHSHREINVWFAAEPRTKEAAYLERLVSYSEEIDADWDWDPGTDEDDTALPPLPEGFADALLDAADGKAMLRITLEPARLPADWSIATHGGVPVLDSTTWETAGRPRLHVAPADPASLPSALDVTWETSTGAARATFPVNVADPSLLPPAAELKDLPVSVLLAVLASTRPLRVAMEAVLRRRGEAHDQPGADALDPLKRFDSTSLLLHRVRQASAALWGLEQRLGRPLTSLDALEWRLTGAIGPGAVAAGLIADVKDGQLTPTEAGFLLAELALAVGAVDWKRAAASLNPADVRRRVKAAVADIAEKAKSLSLDADGTVEGLSLYMAEAFRRARVR